MQQFNIFGNIDELEFDKELNEFKIKSRNMIGNYWTLPGTDRNINITVESKIDRLLKRIATETNVSVKEMKSKFRYKEFSEARYIAMYILHKKYNLTSTRVGKLFDRDHATVLTACKKLEGFMEFDKEFKQKVNNLI